VTGGSTLVCKGILFDLDGVLVDSAECVERTWRAWSSRHGLNAEDVIAVAHGRRTIETVRKVAPHLDAPSEVVALEEREAMTSEGIYEIEGALDLLARIPQERWAIVTSGTRAIASFRLNLVGLPIPRVMVCADEISHGKPHPEGYLTAAARLGFAAAECVVIEDTPPGIAAAHAGGMRAIAIAATYPAGDLSDADVIVERLADLDVSVVGDSIQISI
jgi:mannitol-1-/sugar-/sorbitol-6-phosphatase